MLMFVWNMLIKLLNNVFFFQLCPICALIIQERQTSCEGRSAPCAFRITSEGLPLILPHISKQILSSSAIDFKHLLQYRAVKFADFVDAKFGERAANLMPGCCVVVLGEGMHHHDAK